MALEYVEVTGDDVETGSRIGGYEVVTPLGAGGMGEVYRARDERLGREVAIKVLPEAFVADGERMRRFEREAELLASLNHPYIASIYDVGEDDGVHFLVMELAPGETLAQRLSRGPIPWREAAGLAIQVAEALEAAHARGIVHRDLKPANVTVDEEGRVKVLDFGLAKALAPEVSADAAAGSDARTLSYQTTETGVVLGTAAYMSPEQARGKPADTRADVWAFGCLLYEMLSGRRRSCSPWCWRLSSGLPRRGSPDPFPARRRARPRPAAGRWTCRITGSSTSEAARPRWRSLRTGRRWRNVALCTGRSHTPRHPDLGRSIGP